MKKPAVTITDDFSSQFNKIVQKFKSDKVLVGIPAETSNRANSESGINNAALLAINNFGSPANNIPARPVMENGIRAAQNDISEEFKKAADKGLSEATKGNVLGAENALGTYYERAGIIASNSVKKAINAQDFDEPPAESTIAARRARGFKGNKSLIVTGQMRNAITYVVKRGI